MYSYTKSWTFFYGFDRQNFFDLHQHLHSSELTSFKSNYWQVSVNLNIPQETERDKFLDKEKGK